MSVTTLNLSGALYNYYQSISIRPNPVLEELAAENQRQQLGYMQISPEQGQFLAWLIRLINAKKILEIGTYTGYSALCMAQALPQDGQLICCELKQQWIDIAKPFWEKAAVIDKIQVQIGPAQESLQALINTGTDNNFDFIFIDADKRGYQDYYEKSLTLLRPGGVIAIDNVFRNGNVVNPAADDKATQAICDLNQKLHSDMRIDLSIIPIGDGLTLAHKR